MVSTIPDTGAVFPSLAEAVRSLTGVDPLLCYQCRKCTTGCPVADQADLSPHQVMRAIQLGQVDKALESRMTWLCVSCQICSSRCPQSIDVASVMDGLKVLGLRAGLKPSVPEVEVFNQAGLISIKYLGRMYELAVIAGYNVGTRQLFKDVGMGLGLIKSGNLRLLPSLVRRRDYEPVGPESVRQPAANAIAFFPGCSLHSTAHDYGVSIRAVAEPLGIRFEEAEGWLCCGSKPAAWSSPEMAAEYPLRNLALVSRMGHTTVTTPCAACYSRFRHAIHQVAASDELAEKMVEQTGYRYDGIAVENLVETLDRMVGPRKLAALTRRPLSGLKVACYYGCLLTRPSALTGAADVENPLQMERLVRALGGEPVDWSYKTECCGGSHSITRSDLVVGLSGKILSNAAASGADVVVTACPLCRLNLDGRQPQVLRQTGAQPLPVLYFTQLVGYALGLDPKALAMDKAFVDARPVLAERVAP